MGAPSAQTQAGVQTDGRWRKPSPQAQAWHAGNRGSSLGEARREGFCAGRDLLIDSLVQKPGNVPRSAQRLCGEGGKEREIGGEGCTCAKRSVVPSRASAGGELRAAL